MFVSGYPPHPFLLSRHLPPLEEGVAAAYGERFSAPGDVVLDPFGQSPRVALELVRAGRRVVITSNNPILRLAIGATFNPASSQTLRLALTRLADARLVNERVETYVRRFYSSTCPDCNTEVEVDAFHWEKETLVEKSYHCQTCDAEKTRPVSPADLELAARFEPRGPQFHWALDRAITPDDNAPSSGESAGVFTDALDAYTPRALNAIFTLTNKASTLALDPEQRRALELLLVAAYDEAVSLEGTRPRTLKLHARYRERNIWLALERLARDPAWQGDGGSAVVTVPPTDLLLTNSSAVAIHDGSLRNLIEANLIPQHSIPLVLSALPRPNLVFWVLSALWAGWLWGEPAGRSLRQLIRRRRYDWAWHETALRAGFDSVHVITSKGGHLVALLPEAGPGFVAATLTAADGAGFTLMHHALRADPPEAQFVFQPDALSLTTPMDLTEALNTRAEQAAVEVIIERGEPSRWHPVSGAAFVSLARDHLLRAAVEQPADDPLDWITNTIEEACLKSKRLVTIRNEDSEAETVRAANVWWWLGDPGEAASPLADRTELEVARTLTAAAPPGLDSASLDARVCNSLAGLTLPGESLIRACLESYGEEHDGLWTGRAEDQPDERSLDSAHIHDDLILLGQRLGYQVEAVDQEQLTWKTDFGMAAYQFFVTENAAIARFVLAPPSLLPPVVAYRVLVIPGGRAGLIDYKLKRDPHLRAAAGHGGWLFVKYRHVRWLVAQPDINPAELELALARDPITERTLAQLPLL